MDNFQKSKNCFLFLLCFLVACGGGSSGPAPVTIVSDAQYCDDDSFDLLRKVTYSDGTVEINLIETNSTECGYIPDTDGDGYNDEEDVYPDDPNLWLEQTVCESEYSKTVIDEDNDFFNYINCDGQPQRTPINFIYNPESTEIAQIDILVYIDINLDLEKRGVSSYQELIDREFDVANKLYAASGVYVNLNAIAYIETEIDPERDVIELLEDFRDPDESNLWYEPVDSDMNEYDADLAYIFAEPRPSTICGAAWINNRLERQYSKGFIQCYQRDNRIPDDRGNITFSHEVGHNLGMMHDRDQYSPQSRKSGQYNYSYGWIIPETIDTDFEGYGSIMSYADRDTNFFSSPDITWEHPESGLIYNNGTDKSNAVESMNRTRMTYSKINEQSDSTLLKNDFTLKSKEGVEDNTLQICE